MSPISTKHHGDVLIATSNNPPVSVLGRALVVDGGLSTSHPFYRQEYGRTAFRMAASAKGGKRT